jgi:hypothetical protein
MMNVDLQIFVLGNVRESCRVPETVKECKIGHGGIRRVPEIAKECKIGHGGIRRVPEIVKECKIGNGGLCHVPEKNNNVL